MDPKNNLRLITNSETQRDSQQEHGERLSEVSHVLEKRRLAAKKAKINTALESSSTLTPTVQDRLREELLATGWGKCPHGFARMLKRPRRYGLKLVDISILTTVYDLTIASVNPKYFTSISAQEFHAETELDLRDVRRILSDLCSRGILLKIPASGVNFWGLNPHFFKSIASKNLPLGSSPLGNAPSVKRGNLPIGEEGENTQGQSDSSDENHEEKSTAKNLFQESLKESHLTNEFPDDMLERWKRMNFKGPNPKVEKEKEIFKSILEIHKQTFFEKCGQVVSFLEKMGLTKDGRHQPIHSPMSYLQNHWDTNLAKLEEWTADQKAKESAVARKTNNAAKAIADKGNADQEEVRAMAQKNSKLDAAADRFLELYQDVEKIKEFAREALKKKDIAYLHSFYTKYGWSHHLVREVVLNHFLKVESGECTTEINPELFSTKQQSSKN